jgi:hypothetical protein
VSSSFLVKDPQHRYNSNLFKWNLLIKKLSNSIPWDNTNQFSGKAKLVESESNSNNPGHAIHINHYRSPHQGDKSFNPSIVSLTPVMNDLCEDLWTGSMNKAYGGWI